MADQNVDSCLLLFLREKDHLPNSDYITRLRTGDLDISVRKDALDWIFKASAQYNFGPLTVCLSVNYFDRFLSVFDLPKGKSWITQLLAVACLSLAIKMEEIKVPLLVDLQVGDPNMLFEGKTIQRMELLVLNTLKWRMQPCTPCCFMDYFLKNMTNIDDDHVQSGPLISRSIQIILTTIKGIDFLEFSSSEIAAAVAISVSGELQLINIDKAISSFIHLQKDRVMKCVELMKDFIISRKNIINNNSNNNNFNKILNYSVVSKSPNGVLEAACLSYNSDERTVGSCPNSS